MSESKFVSLKLPVELVNRIEALARANNRSRSNQIYVLLLAAIKALEAKNGQHV